MLANELRKFSIEYTALLLSNKYNSKIKNYSQNIYIEKLFKFDSDIIVSIFLIYMQIEKLLNCNPIEDVEDFKTIPYFIEIEDSFELYTAINKLDIKSINTIKTIYNDYNNTLLEYFNNMRESNNANEVLSFINFFNMLIKKIQQAYDDLMEFIIKLDLKNFNYGQYLLEKHDYLKNYEINYLNKEVLININNNLLSFEINENIEKDYLMYIFLLIMSYKNNILSVNSKKNNTYLTILQSNKFISTLNTNIIKISNFEKQEILLEQLEQFETKIFNSINSLEIEKNDNLKLYDIFKLVQEEFVKYKEYIPVTYDEDLKAIRDKKLSQISRLMINQIIKRFVIIPKKERTDENISNKETTNFININSNDTQCTTRNEATSWNRYSESNRWNTE